MMSAIFFHSMLPLAVPIACVGLFMNYWANKVPLWCINICSMSSSDATACQTRCQVSWPNSSPTSSPLLLSCGPSTQSSCSASSTERSSTLKALSRSDPPLPASFSPSSFCLSQLGPWSTIASRTTLLRPRRHMMKLSLISSLTTIARTRWASLRAWSGSCRRGSHQLTSPRNRKLPFSHSCRLLRLKMLCLTSPSTRCRSRPCTPRCKQ